MQSTLQSLDALEAALREALAQRDWEAVSALDPQCRTLISEVVSLEQWGNPVLRERVGALSQLYAELQQAARLERERVAGELTRLNQSKQVTNAYKPLG
ncbi:flagellar protein FliT [Stutzerimonas nitrititolerans]|uniref:flagellar protein FliT n=1 Tax=Stutzerimonas nitrititolerans TaxID=2482751 RepID=UPI0028AB27DD|nr:flagellar protein FliT [Stutzerimonas nitrititolerans]